MPSLRARLAVLSRALACSSVIRSRSVASLAMARAAQATLIGLGNGTVKDDVTNLIRLQDWNVNGLQNRSTQKARAENLSFAGSDAWVLPSIGQYGTLFAEFGHLTSVNAFMNVQPGGYWSGTEFTPGIVAWIFGPASGLQNVGVEGIRLFAVAVRPADVAAVPEPQTLALVLLALGATVVARRRRPA